LDGAEPFVNSLTVAKIFKEFPGFYGTPRAITVFTEVPNGSYLEVTVISPHTYTVFL
jgi:hypothetical protein